MNFFWTQKYKNVNLARTKNMADICWWDMNGPSRDYSIRPLPEFCGVIDETVELAMQRPHFCTYECAYAFMLKNDYSERQIQSLMCHYSAKTVLRPANDPYILAYPFNGPDIDIDVYRQHRNAGVEVPFAQRTIYNKDVQSILLEPYAERQALLEKVSKKSK